MATISSVTNPTPKDRFQMSQTRMSAHRQLIHSPEFEQAADSAMLQYQWELGLQLRDPNSAMATGLKSQGALEFLQVFRNLAEQPRPLPPPVQPGLNPKA